MIQVVANRRWRGSADKADGEEDGGEKSGGTRAIAIVPEFRCCSLSWNETAPVGGD